MIAGIVLAAGAARRFGAVKQLAPFRGRPLLEQGLLAQAAAPLQLRLLVLGANAEEILAGVELHGAKPVICERWAEGQSESLRTGVLTAAEEEAEAVVVTLGDQPLISPTAIERLIAERDPATTALRASYGGRPGHPVLFERALFDRLGGLTGDAGGLRLLGGAGYREVPCDRLGAATDIDTPEELARMEAAGEPGAGPEEDEPHSSIV